MDCVKGNIATQKGYDAVLNASNAWLRPAGGVSGIIHLAAGSELLEACRQLAPINTGEAVITNGYKLPNRYVIHCRGPVYGKDTASDELLANCYRNALNLAEKYKLASIACPVISTGALGYPFQEAVQVVLKTVQEIIPGLTHVKRITFVIRDSDKYEVFKRELERYNLY